MSIVNGQTIDASDFIGASAYVQLEGTSGVTHSLTTLANQKVLVIVKGIIDDNGGTNPAVELKYNGVTKDSMNTSSLSFPKVPFTLSYFETPGAATANITVVTSAGSIANVKISVIKLRTA